MMCTLSVTPCEKVMPAKLSKKQKLLKKLRKIIAKDGAYVSDYHGEEYEVVHIDFDANGLFVVHTGDFV